MWNVKSLVTGVICCVVEKIPFAFFQRLRDAKEGYVSNKNHCLDLENLSPHEKLTHFSLLDPDDHQKVLGVRNLRLLPQQCAAAALRWKTRHEIWSKDTPERSAEHAKQVDLGEFFIRAHADGVKLPSEREVRVNAKYISHCFLSLMELKNGEFFLDSHCFFTEEATRLLQRFSVEHLPHRHVEYETCNPFKKNFSAATLLNRANLSDKELMRRVNELHAEVENLLRTLQDRIGIRSTRSGISTLEVLSGTGKPYFYEDVLPMRQQGGAAGYHAIDKYKRLHALIWEAENGQTVLFSPGVLKKTNIQHLAISYVAPDNFDSTIAEYRRSFFPAKINYGLFRYYLLLSKQLSLATVHYKDCISKGLSKPSRNYGNIYDVKIDFMELMFRVRSILNDSSFFLFKMNDQAVERAKELFGARLSQLEALNREVDERKAICHEKVLAENLGYQKMINRLVVFLAILQVVVAVIALNGPGVLRWLKVHLVPMFS
ncbi:hypothetical protein [Pseudomonas azotoformans]|nr:hypothetical protein [Pseudomonas azotoformans]SDN62644.1 hypothetical protein SAMN04489799_2438 [Pseudomonas azotoformans]